MGGIVIGDVRVGTIDIRGLTITGCACHAVVIGADGNVSVPAVSDEALAARRIALADGIAAMRARHG